MGDNGTYTATFTPESGVDNYDALTKDGVTLNITKAAYGNQSVSGSAKYGTTGSVDLSRYLAAGGSFGTITTADSEKVLSGDPVMEGNSLKFTFVNDASKANKMATITVPVTGATNYESYTIIVTVTVNDKTTPVVTAPTAKTRLVYNGADQVLIDAALHWWYLAVQPCLWQWLQHGASQGQERRYLHCVLQGHRQRWLCGCTGE